MGGTSRRSILTPLRVTVVYLVFGLLALLASDVLLPSLLSDAGVLRDLQFLKGAVEVVLTAGLIYGLVWYSHRSLRSAHGRLERSDQIMQVLLRLLRHNIRNDMNVIQGYAELATAEAETAAVEDSCDEILATVDELLERTETVNELRALLEGSTEVRSFDLERVVEKTAADLRRESGADVSVSTAVSGPVTVAANTMLPIGIEELVDNAIRHSDSSAPRVEFSIDCGADHAVLRVLDDGPGIPAGERQVLTRLEESPLRHSSGLGLWFVHWVVADSDGEVTIRDRESGGTVVTLTLPLADDHGSVVDVGALPVVGHG